MAAKRPAAMANDYEDPYADSDVATRRSQYSTGTVDDPYVYDDDPNYTGDVQQHPETSNTPNLPAILTTQMQSAGPQNTAPSYVNMNNPLDAAIWSAFQKKGKTPRDQGDFEYWKRRINETGGWGDSGNQNYWLDRMGWDQGGVGDYLERPEKGTGQSQVGTTSTINSTPMLTGGVDSAMNDFLSQFRESILNRLNNLQTGTIDENNPEIKPAIDAYRVQSQRGLDRTRRAIAERNYATGTNNTSGQDIQDQQAIERAGEAESQFAGTQIANVASQRRQELASLLQQGMGFLNSDQQRQIQREIANLDALLRNKQIDQTGRIADNQLGYQYTSLQAILNQKAILAALGLS